MRSHIALHLLFGLMSLSYLSFNASLFLLFYWESDRHYTCPTERLFITSYLHILFVAMFIRLGLNTLLSYFGQKVEKGLLFISLINITLLSANICYIQKTILAKSIYTTRRGCPFLVSENHIKKLISTFFRSSIFLRIARRTRTRSSDPNKAPSPSA